MKLEVGAGNRLTPGYVHHDIRDLDGIEVVCDARKLSIILQEYGKFEEIRATHVLEHISYNETVDVLKEWKKCLIPGGKLYIEVPNFDWQMRAYAAGEIGIEDAVYFVYGEQDYPENAHLNGFNADSLAATIDYAGFRNVYIANIGQVLVAEGYKPLDEEIDDPPYDC